MKICLMGSQPHSVELAPYEDKSYDEFVKGKPPNHPNLNIGSKWINDEWEIWGCSPAAAAYVRRANRWFECHRWEPGQEWFQQPYIQFLKEFRGPVYTGGVVDEIPNHVVYPIERIEAEFSSYFLTSSLALMAAMAILEIEDKRVTNGEAKEDDVIAFFGVDMASSEEYGYQRAGCQFFILEALRRDIGIYVPPESCLLRPMPVYGICEWSHAYIKLTQRARDLQSRRRQCEEAINANQSALAGVVGASNDLDYFVNTFTSPYGLEPGQTIRRKKNADSRRDSRPADKHARGRKAGDDKTSRRRRRKSGNGAVVSESGVTD